MKRLLLRVVASCAGILGVLFITPPVHAVTLTYDFGSGLPGDFSLFADGGLRSEGGLWDVDANGGVLRVLKDADNGNLFQTWLAAGIKSNFQMAGNFTVTVDFDLPGFPCRPKRPS